MRVELQLGAVYGVDERAQAFSADVTLVTAWHDPRLRNPAAPAVAELGAAEVLPPRPSARSAHCIFDRWSNLTKF